MLIDLRHALGCFATALLLAGCQTGADRPCVLVNSDFEQFEGWVRPLPEFLSTEQAHSGRYSYRVPTNVEYGVGYVTKLSACDVVPRRLRLSSWVYLSSGRIRSTKLVVQIMCHGRRPDVWESLEVQEVVKRYQQWEPIHKIIYLPDDLDPTDEVKVYVWHMEAGGETTWFDDLKLEAWR
jgi:hypothetical protein